MTDLAYNENAVRTYERTAFVILERYNLDYNISYKTNYSLLYSVLVKQNCNTFPKNQAIRFCQGVRPLLNE